ncbi:MAG: hypothetical protein WC026_10265 [Hyphomicrobium sp.]|uniref:hypothetical protein n=1 Tax=Hyphomicrobium sp. TaxID=82 RepID=UPI0035651DD3
MPATNHDAARRRVLELTDGNETVFLLRNSWHCHERYTPAEVIEALDATAGLVAMAARRLGCTANTVHNYIRRHPAVRLALETIRAEIADFAMSKVLELIKACHAPTIIWYLSTFGQSRGYGRVRSKPPQPAQSAEKFSIQWRDLDLPPETRRAIEEALVKAKEKAA